MPTGDPKKGVNTKSNHSSYISIAIRLITVGLTTTTQVFKPAYRNNLPITHNRRVIKRTKIENVVYNRPYRDQ